MRRQVLVTGATSGIGLEVATELASAGAHVILGVRNVGRAKTLAIERGIPRGRWTPIQLDLGDLESVQRFAAGVREETSELDVLVNNAGIFAAGGTRSVQGTDLVMATNVVGPFALTGLLLDTLVASKAPRVVHVTSDLYRRADPSVMFAALSDAAPVGPMPLYMASKLANLLVARELDRRWETGPQRSFAVHPGVANTALDRSASGIGRLASATLHAALGRPAAVAATPIVDGVLGEAPPADHLLGLAYARWRSAVRTERIQVRGDADVLAADLWAALEELSGVRFLAVDRRG